MTINFPNLLTLSRIVAIPVVCLLLLLDKPWGSWLALAAFVIACVTDFFDGYLARTWKQVSSFGRFLDPIADKLLIAAVLLMLVGIDRLGGIHIVPAAVILCREILVSGLREHLAEVRVGVPVSRLAKWKTTIQMVALGFLLVGEDGPVFGLVSTTDIGIVGIWAAALLTLITGYDYLRAGIGHMAANDSAERGSVPEPSNSAEDAR